MPKNVWHAQDSVVHCRAVHRLRRDHLLRRLALASALLCLPVAARAQDPTLIVLHLLDYVAVDYRAAVAQGQVIDDAEYREMQEFAAQAIEQIERLPAHDERVELVRQAAALAQRVESRADASSVAAAARQLRAAIIEAYGVRTAPPRPPDLELGQRVYADNCASCHGAQGRGDGAAATDLDPAPSDLSDPARMAERTLYALYSTVTLGVEGTAMASFDSLSDDERWSVAAWIRRFPGAAAPASLDHASRRLAASVTAYREGRRDDARRLAIEAYLDGFEPVEAALASLDRGLLRRTEADMLRLRGALGQDRTVEEVERQAAAIERQFERARVLLSGGGLSPTAAFTSSLLILLREGLEAILVLAAMIAFVKKSGRRDAMPYVHAGWIAALVLGLLTWVAAAYLVEVSGADREVLEGVTALIAAAVLVYVGYWLHSKAHAQAWARFIRERVGGALAQRTFGVMAFLAFLAVYREVFEVVLFYQVLWVQAGDPGRRGFFGGLLTAAVALAALAWLVFRYSVRLPIGPFFALTSIVLACLAVVFAGQGVAALQEAGLVSITPIRFVSAPAVGLFPTLQTIVAQAVIAVVVTVSLTLAARSGRAEVARGA